MTTKEVSVITYDTTNEGSDVLLQLQPLMRLGWTGPGILYSGKIFRISREGDQTGDWVHPLWVWAEFQILMRLYSVVGNRSRWSRSWPSGVV